ncbi:MAG TPA: hypothetical protein VFQ40_06155 [Actinomycetota bacterium]|nr:hypothetical protein [Actinomycetota bacterium]
MTTVGQILDRARHPMRDASEEFFTDVQLIDALNDAIADLAARERLVREETTIASTTGFLVIPAEFLGVRWVKDPDGVEGTFMVERVFFDYKARNPDWPAESFLYTIFDDKVHIHPAPADGVNYAVGNLQVPAVVDDVNDLFPLRRIWEIKAVQWLQAEMYARDGEYELSRRKFAQYESGLRPAQAPTDHQVGPLSIAREPNAFDADPDSIHQGV